MNNAQGEDARGPDLHASSVTSPGTDGQLELFVASSLAAKEAVTQVNNEEDVVSSMETVLFFRLPSEIRVLVYELLFITPLKLENSNFVNSGFDPDRLYPYYKTYLSKGLALLRTCQQVHEEATAVLHGTNKFHFGSQTRDGFSTENRRGEWGPNCSLNHDEQDNERTKPLGTRSAAQPEAKPCNPDPPACGHEAGLITFHITHMHHWWTNIGITNRFKIRHLKISLVDPTYALCIGYTDRPGAKGSMEKYLTHRGFELLSRGHHLQTLELIVGSDPERNGQIGRELEILGDLFGRGRFMRGQLSLITGVKGVKLSINELVKTNDNDRWVIHAGIQVLDCPRWKTLENKDLIDNLVHGCRELQGVMQSGYEERQQAPYPVVEHSRPRIDQEAVQINHEAPKAFNLDDWHPEQRAVILEHQPGVWRQEMRL